MLERFNDPAERESLAQVSTRECTPATEARGQVDLERAIFPGSDQYEAMVQRLVGGDMTYEQFSQRLEERFA